MTTPSIYKSADGERAVMALYDNALAHWPVPYDTHRIPTRHGDAFVIACGAASKPPLVLLHGAGSNSAIWSADVRAYTRHYRVYAIDLLGEAGKSAPNRPPWDGPAYAEWLDDTLTGLGVEHAVLVGISQGAWTALKFAVLWPERVDQLVLMTPGGIVPDRLSFLLRVIPLTLLGQRGNRRLIRMMFAEQAVPDGVEDIMTVMMTAFKPRMGVLPIFTDEELQRLTMPILLLGGTHDALRDLPRIEDRLRGVVPDLTTIIRRGAGHALLDTSGDVLSFLATQRAATPDPVERPDPVLI